MSDYTPKREKDTIDAAVTSASKVPGSLTLNELNAISDKGLVVGGSATNSAFDFILWATSAPGTGMSFVVDGDHDAVMTKLKANSDDLIACVMANRGEGSSYYESRSIDSVYTAGDVITITALFHGLSSMAVDWRPDGSVIIQDEQGGGGLK